jgi:hypothetical protein
MVCLDDAYARVRPEATVSVACPVVVPGVSGARPVSLSFFPAVADYAERCP